jgi:hypothetical protein
MTKLIVVFRNFANAPKSEKELRTDWQIRNSLDPVFGTIYL